MTETRAAGGPPLDTAVPTGEHERERAAEASRALKRTFGTYATGVTIVTTMEHGEPRGFTANSFTSVSIEPPLLLVCHSNRASSHDAFARATGFVVNILAVDQHELAMRFASKVDNRFAGLEWTAGTGGPIIPGAAAWLDCRMHQTHNAGDHTILIGRVLDHAASNRDVLGYWRGGFVEGLEKAVADR